jgi:translation elongation factor EF-1beta
MTNLERSLEAWLGSGKIVDYLVAELPEGPLRTGWVEQSIRFKSVEGGMRSKDNRSALIVTTDRFARLLREDAVAANHSRGVFVFGSSHLDQPRLILVVCDHSVHSGSGQLVVALRARRKNNAGLVTELLGLARSKGEAEPRIDYLEQMRADLVEGLVGGFLSLTIPAGKTKPKDWIRGIPGDSISRKGEVGGIESLGPMIVRWITGLQVFEDSKTPLASLFLLGTSGGLVALWDGVNSIVSFASILPRGLEASIGRYASSLWMGLPENEREQRGSPSVTILSGEGRSPKKKPRSPAEDEGPEDIAALSETVRGLASRLDSIPIEELEQRLRRAEAMGNLETEDVAKGLAKAQVIQRLRETVERLEAVTARMKKIEERVDKIAKRVE